MQEIFPALGSDWQEVGKKRQGTAASGSTSSNTVWGKPTPIPARTPSSNPPASLDPPVAQPSRANGKSSKAPSVSGSVHGDSDHQADPHALATGAFDAPKKPKNKADSVASGPTTFTNGIAAAPSSSKPDNTNMTTTGMLPQVRCSAIGNHGMQGLLLILPGCFRDSRSVLMQPSSRALPSGCTAQVAENTFHTNSVVYELWPLPCVSIGVKTGYSSAINRLCKLPQFIGRSC